MSVSVVNGYVCFSSYDAANAKQGKDPNAPPGSEFDPSKTKQHDGQPATILDGALKDLANAIDGAGDTAPAGSDYRSSPTVDRLA